MLDQWLPLSLSLSISFVCLCQYPCLCFSLCQYPLAGQVISPHHSGRRPRLEQDGPFSASLVPPLQIFQILPFKYSRFFPSKILDSRSIWLNLTLLCLSGASPSKISWIFWLNHWIKILLRWSRMDPSLPSRLEVQVLNILASLVPPFPKFHFKAWIFWLGQHSCHHQNIDHILDVLPSQNDSRNLLIQMSL